MVIHDAMRYIRVRRPWLRWDEAALRRNAGVYLHVPFCLARCRYCDFLTYGREHPAGLDPAAYTAALSREIESRGAWATARYEARGRAVDSVFIGGGTPTYLAPAQLAGIVQAVRVNFPVAPEAEITAEANPDTLSAEYIAALAAAGVNRLSVGIQATQPRLLRLLGRTHRWDNIQPALCALRASGIPRYSFDVIYSLPGLTQRELAATLRRLLALGPEHISAYELTLEQGTPLARYAQHLPRLVPREGETVRQQRLIERVLAGAGLYRYEVSNYARPGAECRHNLRYWRGGDYFGLGLGAASRIGTEVLNNPRTWSEYQRAVESVGRAEWEARDSAGGAEAGEPWQAAWDALPTEQHELAPPADTFLLARTRLGLTGAPAGLRPEWIAQGWLTPRRGGWSATSRGLNFAERLARELD
jgi:oxygen-independent coproporphyrinogen III oxidase